MGRCERIKANGERCRAGAMEGSSWCFNHDPARAEERQANGRKGGKAAGRGRRRDALGEVREVKGQVRAVLGGLFRGTVERDVATAMLTGYNVLARYIELERKVREQEELLERVRALEEIAGERPQRPQHGRRSSGVRR